ncbi:hypothetical protein QTL86_04190 [Cellulosilyticum sp. ST5]|uniref:hypothetical protein n=1 Tax=Cellulosilyticum sp. ST5 TaxID=3055805 RepID=UPI0039778079
MNVEELTRQLMLEQIISTKVEWVTLVIGTTLALITAVAGVYKYYKSKNEEARTEVLKQVYAPLYMILVRQELYRKLYIESVSPDEAPILELTNRHQQLKNNQFTETAEKILDREDFINTIDKINIGLASSKLVTLIAMYKDAIKLEEEFSEKKNEIFWKATTIKCDIEKDLIKEIVYRYNYIYKKLGLHRKDRLCKWRVNKEGYFYIDYDLAPERIEQIKRLVDDSPPTS